MLIKAKSFLDRKSREVAQEQVASTRLHQFSFVNLGLKRASQPSDATKVWIQSYGRSGSSTVLSMLEAAGQNTTNPRMSNSSDIFALFEPCHVGDILAPELQELGCTQLLQNIAQCNFSQISRLWGYDKLHSSILGNPGARQHYSKVSASESCSAADLVVFKTVAFGHNIETDVMPLLERDPTMRVIDIVRDPRAIIASWKHYSLSNWSSKWVQNKSAGANDNAALIDICDNFAANIQVVHPRVKRVAYEDFVHHPEAVMRDVYSFLGLTFGQAQLSWIARTFNANACAPTKRGLDRVTQDCHTNSTEPLDRWRSHLSPAEIEAFATTQSCQELMSTYGYDA